METGKDPVALGSLLEHRFMAAIRARTPESAEAAARAIGKGGVTHLEVTFTVPEAPRVIRALAAEPGLVLGAGTVLTAAEAHAALEAGARFIVAPNLSREVAKVAREAGVLYCPGAYTTNEILAARDAGAHVVKVYPVGVAGGPDYIRVIRDPLPDVPMMASGGTNLDNFLPFLAAGAVAIGLGGALCDPTLVAAGRSAELTARAQAFVKRLEKAYESGSLVQA